MAYAAKSFDIDLLSEENVKNTFFLNIIYKLLIFVKLNLKIQKSKELFTKLPMGITAIA
ncbi:hypothetical protein JQ036_03870 [Clostridium botulinum]|nr:hypothetical protein [Clostridium botulinum]MCS4477215.1 hypothetical protein [Clostridium botulinum]